MSKQMKTVKKPQAPAEGASGAKPQNKQLGAAPPAIDRAPIKQLKAPEMSGADKRKNISQKINNGRILQTRDEYLDGSKDYIKPGYENGKGGNYRKAVVVDSNRRDELAIVKLTTSLKGKEIANSKSKYRPYVYIKDDDNRPIKTGKKFIAQSSSKSFNKKTVDLIKKDLIKYKSNRKKLKELKERDK